MQAVAVEILEGDTAPRYGTEVKELKMSKVVVTARGMKSGLPLVDFQLEDEKGNKYFVAITGAIVRSFGDVVEGVAARGRN